MRKETKTIRVNIETKKEFDRVRGKVSSDKFLEYLIELHLPKKK